MESQLGTAPGPLREGPLKSQNLIHQIGDLVVNSVAIPFVRYRIVNEDRLLDMIEELEALLPVELKQAQDLLGERDKVLGEARFKTEEMLSQTRQQIQALVADHEIVKQAQAEADRIRQVLEADQQRQQAGADRYADEVLAELEAKLSRALSTIQNGRQSLNT